MELEVEESDLRVSVDVMSFMREVSQPKRGSKVDRVTSWASGSQKLGGC